MKAILFIMIDGKNMGRVKETCIWIFIDLERTCDKVSRERIWWVLEKKEEVSNRYIYVIKDMYGEIVTHMRIMRSETKAFPSRYFYIKDQV